MADAVEPAGATGPGDVQAVDVERTDVAEMLEALRTEVDAIRAIKYVNTPWMAFEDKILRRRPSHQQIADEAFARHTPAIAALLTDLVRLGAASPSVAGEVSLLADMRRLRTWMSAPDAELASAVAAKLPLPFPDVVRTIFTLPKSRMIGRALGLRMAGVGKELLREHEIATP